MDVSNVIENIGNLTNSSWSKTFPKAGFFSAKVSANGNGSWCYFSLNGREIAGYNGMSGQGQVWVNFYVPAGGTVSMSAGGGNGQAESAVFYGVAWG